MPAEIRFTGFIERWAEADPSRAELATILKTIVAASARLSGAIARRDLLALDATAGDNRQPLEEYAHRLYLEALAALPVAFVATDDSEDLLEIDRDARFGVALDPLDGASNIETNLSIGTIFSVLESSAEELFDVTLGERQRAAGFVCFGPQTRLVLTCGEGSLIFLLDPECGEFVGTGEILAIPAEQREFAINTSNYRFWEPGMRHFIDDCIAGEEGNLGRDFNMRWNACLVAEAYRILVRGGVFLYPGDSRAGYASGRLRLLCEALPVAMIVEQAGGSASDGREPVLGKRLQSLQQRVPLVFGSPERVAEVIEYVSGTAFEASRFPLFENRGLLRN
jgi:fructose-1,6-bisphosphatase I